MARRRRQPFFIVAALALAAGCASADVRITRSDEAPAVTAPPTDPEPPTSTTAPPPSTNPGTDPDADPSTDPGTDPGDDAALPAIDPVSWAACDDQPAPWECGTISVPLDYANPDDHPITIALNRLPAADPARRIGSIVMNPGGPGGSGLELAAREARSFPEELGDRFDLVGFDPRGVGRSTAVQCPAGLAIGFDSFDACIDQSRDILPFLGTPNVARDLEMIRRAIGDERLSYLGYSYGTAVGAVYTDMFPDRVRALVLDGAIDPDAGRVNTTGDFGDDYYADQDFQRTVDVFHELCDATALCAAGPDSEGLLERLDEVVRDLPTDAFADGDADSFGRSELDDVVTSSMYSATVWPLLAIALKDADDGDASTLAAFSSWLLYGYPADTTSEPEFEFAHLAIQCADFAGRSSSSYPCDSFPASADPLPEVDPVDAASPVLVIGTADDPATPGRYADQMATALGDAVDIEWEGAGHTAFLTSRCVNEIVVDYFVDLTVPADGTMCPFVVGAATIAARADAIFADPEPATVLPALEDVLVASGETPAASHCIASRLVRRGNQRLIAHQLLGVQSSDLSALRRTIDRSCATAG
jgi:pimeloyl-ACP methyl ester carboxylesterase